MEEIRAIEFYGPYILSMAKRFSFSCCQGRVALEDLLQDGYLTVLQMCRKGMEERTALVDRAIRLNMLRYISDNCSAAHITRHGHRALAERQSTSAYARTCAFTALQLVIPLDEQTLTDQPSCQEALLCHDDESILYVRTFIDALPHHDRQVCIGLLKGQTQEEISRSAHLPLSRVRRTVQRLRKRLRQDLEEIP